MGGRVGGVPLSGLADDGDAKDSDDAGARKGKG